jgi:hypothetical protein
MDNELDNSTLSIAAEALKLSRRAFEKSAENDAAIQRHLIDCDNRFKSLQTVTVTGFVVMIGMLATLTFVATHFGLSLH